MCERIWENKVEWSGQSEMAADKAWNHSKWRNAAKALWCVRGFLVKFQRIIKCLRFFLMWRSARMHQFPPFWPGPIHSGSASWDNFGWMSVPRRVDCELVSLIGSHIVPGRHSQRPLRFVGSRMCACLSVLCYLHFWQNDRGLFTCHCGNTGMERTSKQGQHR